LAISAPESFNAPIPTAPHQGIGTTGIVDAIFVKPLNILSKDLSINHIHVFELTAIFTTKNIKNNHKK